MTKMEYAQEIAEAVGGTAQEVKKNNGMVLIGITIKDPESNLAPCVYIDSMFDEGLSIAEAVNKIKEIIQNNPAPNFDPLTLTDFNKAKQFLSLRLYNADNEYEIYKSASEYGFDDLIIIPVLTGFMPNASMKVGESFIETWGVSEEEVFATAEANTNADDYSIISMTEITSGMMGIDPAEIPQPEMDMYIITNSGRMFGAYGAIVLKDKLKERFPDGYIVIPSSIHEVIVVPNIGNDDEIRQIINEVNATVVAPDEVLGSKPYVFT